MKVLLVEDEAPKRKHIENYITQIISKNLLLSTAMSVNSAIDSIEKDMPDILLLDMSLPTFDIADNVGGGRPQGFGGIEVMRHMTNAGLFCPVIIITGYEAFPRGGRHVDLTELENDLEKEFGDLIKGVLHFNSAYEEWKNNLSKVLNGESEK